VAHEEFDGPEEFHGPGEPSDDGLVGGDGRSHRWAPLLLFAAPVLLALALATWLFAGDVFGADHPFGDARACAGSDTPLVPALEEEHVGLPATADQLHYSTREQTAGGTDGVSLAVAFRSTRQAVADFLVKQNLVAADQADDPQTGLDGVPVVGGDADFAAAGCHVPTVPAPFVTITKELTGGGSLSVSVQRPGTFTFDSASSTVSVQNDGPGLAPKPWVYLTVTR
jgi:hypothetical protein